MKTQKKRKPNKIWVATKKVLGVIFIVIGIAGLAFPIMPDILLILLGLTFLNNESITKSLRRVRNMFKKFTKTK